MRKFITIICTAAAIASAVGCAKLGMAEDVSIASRSAEEQDLIPVTLGVTLPSATVETKALEAYVNVQDYEEKISSIQYLVFDKNSDLYLYQKVTSAEDIQFYARQGDSYTVWAVANLDQDLSTVSLTDLQQLHVTMTGNEKTDGFVLYGSTSSNFYTSSGSGKEQTLKIYLSRLMSRVALAYVKNDMPAALGDFVLEGVFLADVPGETYFDKALSAKTIYSDTFTNWYNWHGRNEYNKTDQIIDGVTYKAQMPDLTYKALSGTVANGETYSPSTPDLLYTFSNASTGLSSYTTHDITVVLMARINGQLQYYPMAIYTVDRNTTVTLGVTITGYGSDDPMKTGLTVQATSTVTVSGWSKGSTYERTL